MTSPSTTAPTPARGLADRGVPHRPTDTDRATSGATSGAPPSASSRPPEEESFDALVARGLAERGLGDDDLLRLLRLLELGVGGLPGPVAPGTQLFLRILRFLLDRGDYDRAYRLFARAGDEGISLVSDLVDRFWLIGLGIAVDVSVGATFGVPLKLDASSTFSLVRDTARTFKLVRQGVLEGGFDTALGGSGRLQLGPRTAGVRAGAQAQAVVQLTVFEEFSFPVFDDPGFAPLLVHLLGAESLVAIAATFDRTLLALSPEPYRQRLKVEVTRVARLNAQVKVNLPVAAPAPIATPPSLLGRLWRRALRSLLEASLHGEVELQLGSGIEVTPDFALHDGGWQLRSLQIELYAEAEASAALTAKLALLPIPVGRPLHQGGGLRVVYRMGPPFDLAAARYVRHEVYSKTGDLDIFQGPAHELAIALPNFRDATLDDLVALLAAVGGAVLRHRSAVSGAPGSKIIKSLTYQRNFTNFLDPKYREYGLVADGFVTLTVELSREELIDLIVTIAEALIDAADEAPDVAALARAVVRAVRDGMPPDDVGETVRRAVVEVFMLAAELLHSLLESGAVPPPLGELVTVVLRRLIASIDKVHLRVQLGFGAAVELSAGAGGRARVHASAVGRVTFDRDITDWLGEQLSAGLLEVEELLALLRGELDDASPVLVISPAELPPVGGEVRSSDGRASGDRQPMRASER